MCSRRRRVPQGGFGGTDKQLPVITERREGHRFHGIGSDLDVGSFDESRHHDCGISIAAQHHVVSEDGNVPVALDSIVVCRGRTPRHCGDHVDSLIHGESANVCGLVVVTDRDNNAARALDVTRAVERHVRRAETAQQVSAIAPKERPREIQVNPLQPLGENCRRLDLKKNVPGLDSVDLEICLTQPSLELDGKIHPDKIYGKSIQFSVENVVVERLGCQVADIVRGIGSRSCGIGSRPLVNREIPSDQAQPGGGNQGPRIIKLGHRVQNSALQNHVGHAGIKVPLEGYDARHRSPWIHDPNWAVDSDLKAVDVPKIDQSFHRVSKVGVRVVTTGVVLCL